MIEQVLFTMPGERVNRPDFGSGVMQLVFAPASDEMATAAEFLVRGNLQQWLGGFLESELFLSVMKKYPAWQPDDVVTYFP